SSKRPPFPPDGRLCVQVPRSPHSLRHVRPGGVHLPLVRHTCAPEPQSIRITPGAYLVQAR
ncbi:MAG TPA: hypothetical protein VLC52_14905, partial [Anaerolineae bacterium]|nr:hypothetical protein [Anaerolineae bacterium]